MNRVCLKYCLLVKFVLLNIIFIICASKLEAQIVNLVIDPSFEFTDSFINDSPQLSLIDWNNIDTNKLGLCNGFYLHTKSSNSPYKLPNSQWCFQNPHSGNGFYGFDEIFGLSNERIWSSIIKSKLKSKLIAGQKYCVSFYVNNLGLYTKQCSDAIQIYFDNGQLDTILNTDTTSMWPFLHPQISNKVGNFIQDTINWLRIMDNFIANGTETYLTIGNFKSNDSTNYFIWASNNAGDGVEYGIDDVSVYPIDLANWLPASYGCAIGDSALIGLPNYETPDAKWFTYNMVLIDSGSQIKVKPLANGTKYICGIDMCNTMVFDTVEVRWWPLAISNEQLAMNNLKVWPNPATDAIQVSNVMGDKVGLYNAVGQLVAEQKVVQNKATVQVAHLPKGVYVVKTVGQIAKVVLR
jgi:hypothetical protein